jgi:hypothetical protein
VNFVCVCWFRLAFKVGDRTVDRGLRDWRKIREIAGRNLSGTIPMDNWNRLERGNYCAELFMVDSGDFETGLV